MDEGYSSGALSGAVGWTGQLMTGSAATSIAVMAVAVVGGLLLVGRLPVRRGAWVIVGCFVVFAAGSIARGLVGDMSVAAPVTAASEVSTLPVPTIRPATPYDPYAGAAVPVAPGWSDAR